MKIGDKVLIINCGTKYPEYNLQGKFATIVNVYGTVDPNYALKVDGVKNPASNDGLFYLKRNFFLDATKITPAYRPVSSIIMDDIHSTENFMRQEIFRQAFANTISIKKVIFNRPATIVIWSDNTKTVVKRQKGDRWDKEKGLAMCIIKKLSGNTGKYYEVFKRYCNE